MEPVTHILTGACLARAGFNRRAAYATVAMAIGAELPDIDTVWTFVGPVASFQHHRGITHTFLGLPVEAACLVAAIYAVHRFRSRQVPVALKAPMAWGELYFLTLLALLSHLLLDFTNNYGIRPFFPFNPHWYAGSFVFIFDPLLFLLLLLPIVMPPLFALVGSEVGSRKETFRGRGWALAALAFIVSLWSVRAIEHAHAEGLAQAQFLTLSQPDSSEGIPQNLQPLRVLANPDPLSPFRWHVVADFGPLIQLSEVNLLGDALSPGQAIYRKPARTSALLAAESSPLGRAYIDWSPIPLLDESNPGDPTRPAADVSALQPSPQNTVITFRDPRFMGRVAFFDMSAHSPLTGTVELDPQNRVVRQLMDGRAQR